MSEHWTDRLSEYLDGELSPGERASVESHVAGCAGCARTLDELRAVVAEARALPDVEPERDLWAGIEARLTARGARDVIPLRAPDAGPRRVTFSIPQLIAAGIALVLFSASGVWLALAGDSGAAPTAVPGVALEQAVAGATTVSLTAAYDDAITELEAEFARRRDGLDPATILVVERNLALIDGAIADARRALEADPSSGFLSTHLANAMRRKVDLLRQAATIERTEI